jgi:cyclic beta-1,2-glucan synthetase
VRDSLIPEPGLLPLHSLPRAPLPLTLTADLIFKNELGGFVPPNTPSASGEYVMEIGPGRRPPLPWSNVIAGPRFGALVTEAGSSFTWFENSQKNRITPWSNDPTLDPSGELFFVRDQKDGAFWSLTPAPAGGDAVYTVRHGQGYSSFEHSRNGIDQRVTVSVSVNEPVKVWNVTLTNTGAEQKTLRVFGVVEWVLGSHRENLRLSTLTSFKPELHAILARNPLGPFPQSRAFFASTESPRSYTGDRQEFFGRWSLRERPAALSGETLSGRVGPGLDPAAVLEIEVNVGPGETRDLSFILGAGEDERQALELLTQHIDGEKARAVQTQTVEAFQDILGQIRVKTPDPAFDLLTNHWLLYQVLSCRFWGRSGFYQSGGAYGFRDQLQDSMALIHTRPDLAREHLLVSASRQFVEGDVQHWWHADTGEGVRTQCSDDLLWLPWAALEYAFTSGDQAIWDTTVPFLQERRLEPGEDDLYSVPPSSEESATLYEHCVRAINEANTQGPHGLPLMRAGDWNDGMSRVGLKGQGESVWLAWFLASVLDRFAKLAQIRGDSKRAVSYRAEATRLGKSVDQTAWDGAWYRRASFDDGQPLGSKNSPECSIDAIAQSWAVLSKRGQPERARQALDSSLAHLLDREQKMLLLLKPPFEGHGPDPGYIAAYPAGIRENGGQYTHGILWTVLALLEQGRGDEGHEVLSMLNPIHHTTKSADLTRYQVEPYVLAADVYSQEPHVGRGGWTWYTGSASWMYRIGVEGLLGLRRLGDELEIRPCVPQSWEKFEVDYRTPTGGTLKIVFENPEGVCQGVVKLTVDGKTMTGNRVRFPLDEREHQVTVTLGRIKQVAHLG